MDIRCHVARLAATIAGSLLVAGALWSCGGQPAAAEAPLVDVQLGRYTIAPETLLVPAGAVDLRVTNVDDMVHSLVVAGRGTRQLAPGESQTISVETEPGDYRMWCDIAGHVDMGQTGTMRSAAGAATTTLP
jgi:plastocyanin